MMNLDSILKSRDITLPTKVSLVKTTPYMDVRVGLQRKVSTEDLRLLNCDGGEDLESPLDLKKIQPVNPKGNQP